MNLTTRILRCLCAICIFAGACAGGMAQSRDSSAVFAELQKQLDAQARQIEDLQNRLNIRSETQNSTSSTSAESAADLPLMPEPPSAVEQQQDSQAASHFGVFPASDDVLCTPGSILRLPLAMEQSATSECGDSGSQAEFHKLNYFADYDNGFRIRPFDVKKHPFEIKVNGWMDSVSASQLRSRQIFMDGQRGRDTSHRQSQRL